MKDTLDRAGTSDLAAGILDSCGAIHHKFVWTTIGRRRAEPSA